MHHHLIDLFSANVSAKTLFPSHVFFFKVDLLRLSVFSLCLSSVRFFVPFCPVLLVVGGAKSPRRPVADGSQRGGKYGRWQRAYFERN
jgi:hypothetical protein